MRGLYPYDMIGTWLAPPASLTLFGRFHDSGTERDFQMSQLPMTRRRMRFVCAMTVPAYLAGIYADSLLLQGDALLHMALARVAVAVVGLLPLVLSFRQRTGPRLLGCAIGAYMSSIMACEVLELVLKAGIMPMPETPITTFIVLMFYIFLPPQIWQPLLAAGLGSLAYLAALATLAPLSAGSLSNTAIVFAMSNAFGAYFYHRFGGAQRREYLAVTQLRHRAETDGLTGLYNRRRVMELSLREFNTAERYGYPCSLLIVDIDHFKSVNDTYGHAVGDAVLTNFAARCGDSLREADLLGRIGGEEFLVFMPHISLDQALQAAQRLRLAVAQTPFQANGASVDVTVSIGAAELSANATTLDRLIMAADAALYRAKKEGRNRVCAAGDEALSPGACPI